MLLMICQSNRQVNIWFVHATTAKLQQHSGPQVSALQLAENSKLGPEGDILCRANIFVDNILPKG